MSDMKETRQDIYDTGMKIRRAVVGDTYVDKSLASMDDFNRDLQNLITEYCWGAVWGRPGLERRERSILNLGMLIALNRGSELKLHVRGALNNGISREEISEIILQTAIYCGVPAGLEATRIAREVFAEVDKK
ncbi:MAG TPA: 4-carboxymuconolactone decarboxylase [Burkholderiales bacterium]|jgi:4-carboxymuconolactone decarboxylase|nr:4-carboxymuconolactone decarboxylase [Burkholderiales bacterium]